MISCLKLVRLSLYAFVVTQLSGCDRAKELYAEFTSTPEQRMRDRSCGGSASDTSVLGISVGMSLTEAVKILTCYDSKASFEQGTSGSNAKDVNKFLREKNSGKSGYSNMFVWTRGTVRNCSSAGEGDSTTLAESLRPDDVKFTPWVFSGRMSGSGFLCFAKLTDQVAFFADGPPNQQVISGIWRVHVPPDGSRPPLDSTFETFSSRYPALDARGARRTAEGFAVEGFTDENGRKLNGPQIRSDYATLKLPTAPTPPKTTEPCGLLWMKTCDRTPTSQENESFASATEAYNQQLKEYKERSPAALKYYQCVKYPPSSPIERTVSEQETKECGTSYFTAAKGYPGGVVEAFFFGIYSHPHARSGNQRLVEYLKQFRGTRDESQNKPTL